MNTYLHLAMHELLFNLHELFKGHAMHEYLIALCNA